ncbi:MAG: hypothetical protein RIT81_26210 [Deltaproteobacteria bacterium]
MKRAALIALAVTACAQDPLLIAPPWDDDAQVVLLVDGEVRSVIAGQAAAFDFDDVVDRELVALVYPPATDDIPDFSACGVATVADPTNLPPAITAWRVVVRDDGEPVSFEPTESRPSLALVRCTYDPCPETTTASWAIGDEDDEIRGVTFLPDGDVVIALGDGPRGGWVVRLRDGEEVWRHPVNDYAKGIGFDGVDTLYTREGYVLVALDLDGRRVTPPQMLDEVEQLRSDGVGGVAARRTSGITSIDGAWPDLAGTFHALAIVPGGTGLAADDRGIWRLEDAVWQLDLRDAAFSNVGGDGEVLIALSSVADFIVFRDGRWQDFAGPPEPAGLVEARGRGDGQLVLAGNQGRLWFQDGGAWCEADTETGQRLESLAVSADGRRLVVGGAPATEHPDEVPVLSIVTILD